MSRSHLRLAATATLAASVGLTSACGEPPKTTEKVVAIGAVLDRTGPLSVPQHENVLKLAFEHANAGLKAAGYRDMQFKYVLSDNQNDPALAVTRAVELRASDDVKAIINDGTEVSKALNKTFYDDDASNDLGVPVICAACNAPAINNPNASDTDAGNDPVMKLALQNGQKWNFRSLMSSLPMGNVFVNIAMGSGNGDVNGDGKFKIATYAIDDSFGKGGANGVKNAALSRDSGAIVEQKYVPFGSPVDYDYATDLAALTDDQPDGKPDIIVESLSPQYSTAMSNVYSKGGYGIRMLHNSPFRNKQSLDLLGDLANGHEGVAAVVLDGPSGAEFNTAFRALTQVAPTSRDSLLYDATMVVLVATVAAVETNGLEDPTQVTGEMVRDALRNLSDPTGEPITSRQDFKDVVEKLKEGKKLNYVGASGPMDFDDNNNVRQRITHWRVENRSFVEGNIYDCVAQFPACPLMQQ